MADVLFDKPTKGSAMFLFSWGKRRKPAFLSEEQAEMRGGVYPCTAQELWVFNNCLLTGAEHPAVELNYTQVMNVRAYVADHPEFADKFVSVPQN